MKRQCELVTSSTVMKRNWESIVKGEKIRVEKEKG